MYIFLTLSPSTVLCTMLVSIHLQPYNECVEGAHTCTRSNVYILVRVRIREWESSFVCAALLTADCWMEVDQRVIR